MKKNSQPTNWKVPKTNLGKRNMYHT